MSVAKLRSRWRGEWLPRKASALLMQNKFNFSKLKLSLNIMIAFLLCDEVNLKGSMAVMTDDRYWKLIAGMKHVTYSLIRQYIKLAMIEDGTPKHLKKYMFDVWQSMMAAPFSQTFTKDNLSATTRRLPCCLWLRLLVCSRRCLWCHAFEANDISGLKWDRFERPC